MQHVGVADTIGVGTPLKGQRAIEATLKHFGIEDAVTLQQDLVFGVLCSNLLGQVFYLRKAAIPHP